MEANDFIKYCHTLLQIISIPMDISKQVAMRAKYYDTS